MSLLLAKPKAELLLSQLQGRTDVSPPAGGKEYLLDSEKNVRAAWTAINKPKNAAKYSSAALRAMKGRIKAAALKLGITISATEKQSLDHDTPLPLIGEDCYAILNRQWYSSSYPGQLDGSIEKHLECVYHGFREWGRVEEDGKFRWGNILGVSSDSIVFYCSNYDFDCSEIEYYKVGYSTSLDGEIAIDGTVAQIDVKLVIAELSADESAAMTNHPIPDGTQEGQSMEDKTKKQDDVVVDESVIADIATGNKGPEAGAGVVVVPTPGPTEANTGGATIPDASGAAGAAKGPGLSDEEGVKAGEPAGHTTDLVKEALTHTAPGYKGQAVQGDAYDQFDVSMAYIQSVKIAEADGKKTMKIQGIATRGDIVNKAGQVYTSSVWEKNLPNMNALAAQGKFLGKLEHPLKEQGLVDTAIKWDKFWLQGADVWFDATIVPTEPYGKNLQTLIESGVQVDMSTRGYGTFANQDWRGTERPVMQDDFICTAIDAVWRGASTGSGVKSAEYQSDPNIQGAREAVEKKEEITQSDVQIKAAGIRAKNELTQTRVALVEQAQLNDLGLKAYKQALEGCESLENLITTSETLLPHLQGVFPKAGTGEAVQSDTYQPTFYHKASQEETAPQTVGELFDKLVQDLPDHYPGQDAAQGDVKTNHFRSPRAACKRLMCNVFQEDRGGFNGEAAARGLMALEQGNLSRAHLELTQSLPAGGTIVGDGTATYPGSGAPLSNYLIFPLIRRVYPMYIMNEIASIQPMDRPEGKIFFLDHYRVNESPSELRVDLNTSANPFNSSYANNGTNVTGQTSMGMDTGSPVLNEGATANLIRLRLSSILVQAHTKKLGAAWSIEEMQDLRAYHGLDAAQELLGGIAREMALEWNKEVLDDMLAQATAGALSFGTLMPSGFSTTQKDWDEYIWVYLQALDNAIFSKRNGAMTHIVCGVDAALALMKSGRMSFSVSGKDGTDAAVLDQYPGTTFYGTVTTPAGSRLRVLRTNFWGAGTVNGAKILGLRKGSDWSDTPYIWAPYTDYVTPMLTDPSDFTQKQGIISRAAKAVVVPDAMGYLTVTPGGQGVVL